MYIRFWPTLVVLLNHEEKKTYACADSEEPPPSCYKELGTHTHTHTHTPKHTHTLTHTHQQTHRCSTGCGPCSKQIGGGICGNSWASHPSYCITASPTIPLSNCPHPRLFCTVGADEGGHCLDTHIHTQTHTHTSTHIHRHPL